MIKFKMERTRSRAVSENGMNFYFHSNREWHWFESRMHRHSFSSIFVTSQTHNVAAWMPDVINICRIGTSPCVRMNWSQISNHVSMEKAFKSHWIEKAKYVFDWHKSLHASVNLSCTRCIDAPFYEREIDANSHIAFCRVNRNSASICSVQCSQSVEKV